jgi:hypothetical protein
MSFRNKNIRYKLILSKLSLHRGGGLTYIFSPVALAMRNCTKSIMYIRCCKGRISYMDKGSGIKIKRTMYFLGNNVLLVWMAISR